MTRKRWPAPSTGLRWVRPFNFEAAGPNTCLQIAKLMGAKFVVGTSTNDARRAKLKEYGADLVTISLDVDPNEDGALLKKFAAVVSTCFGMPVPVSDTEITT